ncbi:ketosteroid isomerase [Glycomyces fuscus]|nr:ketosteroid isomerase [Glycomyces fuscus]
MYAAEARYLSEGGTGGGDFAPLAEYFAADVVLYQAEGLPYGGTWRGHHGTERFFAAMGHTWESFDMVERRFLARRGTLVVLTRIRARSRRTRRETGFPLLQTITVEDRRITEVRPFYWDTAAIMDVCTVQAPDAPA